MNLFGIDCYTKSYKSLINALIALTSTKWVSLYEVYSEDITLCSLRLESTMEEKELDEWLYNTKDIDYIGCWFIEKL